MGKIEIYGSILSELKSSNLKNSSLRKDFFVINLTFVIKCHANSQKRTPGHFLDIR